MVALSLSEFETFQALGDFLTAILPPGVDVSRGQDNRVPEPIGSDFVTMTPIMRERLETNIDDYSDALFAGSIVDDLLTITDVAFGSLAVGSILFGTGIVTGTTVTAFGTGSGGLGTYTVDPPQTIGPIAIAAGEKTLLQPTKVTIQLDVHGPASGDNAQIISTLFRDEYAVDQFAASGFDIAPLYVSDPRQIPFVSGEQQVELRWSIDACMQCNPVARLPQQFAGALVVGVISVDVAYPPPAPPAAPLGIAAQGGIRQVLISWNEQSQYNLYWRDKRGLTIANANKIAGVHSPYLHEGLIDGGEYFYIVSKVDENGEGEPSAEVRAITAPPAPASILVMGGPNMETIMWPDARMADTYDLFWSLATGVTPETGTKIENVQSAYQHLGRDEGVEYFYVVVARNSSGVSPASPEGSAFTRPNPPANFVASGGVREVTLTWIASPGSTSSNLYWSTDPDFTIATGTKIEAVSSPYVHTGRDNGTEYFYLATCVDIAGESEPSLKVNATTVPLPLAPTGLNAIGGNQEIALTWNTRPGETNNLYWSLETGVTPGTGTLIADVSTPYLHTGRDDATEYFYILTAVNIAGEGPPCAEQSGLTRPAAPINLTALGGMTQITLNWNLSAGATSYNAYWSDAPGVTPESGTLIENVSPGEIISGLLNNTAYYAVVTALNASGESLASNEANATTDILNAPTGLMAINGAPQQYALTAVVHGDDIKVGFSQGAWGAILPGVYSGEAVIGLWTVTLAAPVQTVLTINAEVAQGFFFALLSHGRQLNSADATFNAAAGVSTWTWSDAPMFTEAGEYPVWIYP